MPSVFAPHIFSAAPVAARAAMLSRPLGVAAFALVVLAAAALLAAPADAARRGKPAARAAQEPLMFSAERVTTHREQDDLLTAGLGPSGLRLLLPPAVADAAAPTAAELRRRAIWSNWRGIADLAPGGGYGEVYGSLAAVPGREFSAYATVPGAHQPHRVLVQVPDGFDHKRRCVVVAASSGSRGVYGAIAVAGAWGLPKGCAIAYTDKGNGTDYFDLDAGQGVGADGRLATRDAAELAFAPEAADGARGVAFKHAHSQDNPEAAWGLHVRQAAEYALHALNAAFPDAPRVAFDNTTVIAVGLSNGAGAVLRAAALDGDWLDAVVAAAPNVQVDHAGSRALYDYATEAALLMPCALAAMDNLPQPPLRAQVAPLWAAQCAALRAQGLLDGETADAQAQNALARLRAGGWSDQALRAGALSVGFDLWRAVAVAYASAYGRYRAGEHPCGYGYSALGSDAAPRAATAIERATWWSDASGIPPGAGVLITDAAPATGAAADPLRGLRCLRGLWTGNDADARRVQAGIAEVRTAAPRAGLPVVVIHGIDDGLIPMAFTSTPYVAHARAAGRDVGFWQVANVQHFDGFLGLPDYGARYLPLLPYVYAALDRSLAHLEQGAPLPQDAVIQTRPRAGAPLGAEALALPTR